MWPAWGLGVFSTKPIFHVSKRSCQPYTSIRKAQPAPGSPSVPHIWSCRLLCSQTSSHFPVHACVNFHPWRGSNTTNNRGLSSHSFTLVPRRCDPGVGRATLPQTLSFADFGDVCCSVPWLMASSLQSLLHSSHRAFSSPIHIKSPSSSPLRRYIWLHF